jgi:hypothetical protein
VEPLTGLDLAIHLAGMIEADGGMPGRDPAERLAVTLLAILTLLDLGARHESPMLSDHIERMAVFVEGQKTDSLTPTRQAIANKVLRMVHDPLGAEGPGNPASFAWHEVANRCVVVRKGKPDQGWVELEKRLGKGGCHE